MGVSREPSVHGNEGVTGGRDRLPVEQVELDLNREQIQNNQ